MSDYLKGTVKATMQERETHIWQVLELTKSGIGRSIFYVLGIPNKNKYV